MGPRGRGLRSFTGLAQDVVFPGRCLGCGTWLLLEDDPSIPVCSGCLAQLAAFPEPRCRCCGVELISERDSCMRCRSTEYRFHSHRSLFPYTGMAKCLLQALKFGGRRRLAGLFACRAAYELKLNFKVTGAGAVVVPVPPRPNRREPDAVGLVAERLRSEHAMCVGQILVRTASTQQKSLDYEQRRQNLRGGIQVNPRFGGTAPPRIVLLDDVFTTGATVDACARVLLEAGCSRVDALTLVMEE